MWIETSTVALRTLVLSMVLLAGCAAPREAVEPPGAAPAPSEARGPPTAPIARIEPGGHTAPIKSIATDAEGRVLVTGSDDKTVRHWSLADGMLLKTLRVPIGGGNEGKVYAVAISPDGRTVAAGGWTGDEWDGSFSIYLFDIVSSRLTQRLAGLPNVVMDLSYSADGQYLAAGLGDENGIRIYRVRDGELVYADPDYGDSCFSVNFGADGRLVTGSFDGQLRLYAIEWGRFLRVADEKAPGDGWPYTARFSPDGTQIAVGFRDATAVNVFDGQNLALLFPSDTDGVNNGDLAAVAWSRDGRYLYAGGRYDDGSGFNVIRRWAEAGRGPYRDLPASQNTIFALESLPDGRLIYGAADPAFGVFDASGRKVLDRPSGIADLRGEGAKLLLSRDGRTVQFGFEVGGERPARFSLDSRRIDTNTLGQDASLRPTRTEFLGSLIWDETEEPKVNGKPLALEDHEVSHSLAVHPGGKRFLLGAEWHLYYFDSEGRELWSIATPSVAWGVNIAESGEVAVAAFGDGTLRWYRLGEDKGEELLVFFPHPDGKRWVLWNPEGFFDAAPGAEDLVGFHLNRGPDAAAEFVAAGQLADLFYRPDLVTAYLDGNEEAIAEAKEKGALARLRTRDLGAVLASGLPPELELVGPTQVQTNSPDFQLRFRVSDRGGGIGRVEYRVNGAVIQPAKARLAEVAGPKGSGVFVQDFTLAPRAKPNRVEAVVYNKKGTVQSRAAAVAVQVSAPEIQQQVLHVLAVGIDKYPNSALTLQYAAGDAKAFADTLVRQAQGLFAPGEVIVLPDGQATRVGIEAAFEHLSTRVQASDVFVLYLAGHGRTFDGRYHFLPSEAVYRSEEELRSQSLSEEDLKGLLRNVRAQNSLLVLDTCEAGAAVDLAFVAKMQDAAVSRLVYETGRAVLSATSDNDVALEGYKEHGVFTYFLLEGLRGGADRPEPDGPRDGKITIDELAHYVEYKVPRITLENFGKKVTPESRFMDNFFQIARY